MHAPIGVPFPKSMHVTQHLRLRGGHGGSLGKGSLGLLALLSQPGQLTLALSGSRKNSRSIG